jgi:uncharacterized protein
MSAMQNISGKRVLLFGGGGVHDFKAICPVLKEYLEAINGITVDYVVEDYSVFHAERIKDYDLAVVYHTGGELKPEPARGLVEWVSSGKGFVGIHSAADSFKNSPEYISMLGGVFKGHPPYREYIVGLTDIKHPVTADIEGYKVKDWEKWPVLEFKVSDEQYLLDYDPRVHILAVATYSGIWPYDLSHGVQWPVAWVKRWGKGRVFYLALGHNYDACKNPFFKKIFINGSSWALTQEPEEVKDSK